MKAFLLLCVCIACAAGMVDVATTLATVIHPAHVDLRALTAVASIALPGASQTIAEFCASERISRSMYYKLRRLKKAPREMAVGTAVRISPEARADWRREREAESAIKAQSATDPTMVEA